jgi:outer membrane protein assembly factor BamB
MVKGLLKILKYAGMAFVALFVIGAVLFMFGLRVVLDGGGSPHLRFVKSADAQAKEIAQHREAQRAAAPQGSTPAPPLAPGASTESVPADATKSGPSSTKPPLVAVNRDPGGIYWTDFRGPLRDGHYRERPIFTDWPADGLKPIWKQPVGAGYASFVIARGRAFTIEQRGPEEVVASYDVRTGRELWTNAWTAAFRETMGGDGPRATPTWAEGRVFALGAEGELRSIDDTTGKTVWRVNILQDAGAKNLEWGMAGSPLIVDNTVVVLPGGPNKQSIVAYDRNTGARAWSAEDDQQSYSSPMLATVAGVRQILVFSASRVMGLSPAGGKVLWSYPWKTQFDINASQPIVVGDNRIFVSTGYGKGAAMLELTPSGETLSVRLVWSSIRMKNQFSSSILHDGYIYGLDEAILACIDAATGDLRWKGGRYGYGQVMLASGHLIVLTDDGDLVLVRATPERHEERARFHVLDGKTWNHPAMADGYLLIRNLSEMAAFDLRGPW